MHCMGETHSFFLGAIAKLQKKFTISFAMPVRPSFRKEQFRSRWTDFLDLFCLNSFRKSGDKIQFFIKIEQEFRVLYMKTTKYFWSNLPKFFLKWELFQTKVVEKIKTHILLSTTSFFFRKSCRLWDKVEKFCRTGQATDDNMTHAYCVLNN